MCSWRYATNTLLTNAWYKYDLLHRVGNPAIIVSAGDILKLTVWYENGKLHRNDGPAITINVNFGSNDTECYNLITNAISYRWMVYEKNILEYVIEALMIGNTHQLNIYYENDIFIRSEVRCDPIVEQLEPPKYTLQQACIDHADIKNTVQELTSETPFAVQGIRKWQRHHYESRHVCNDIYKYESLNGTMKICGGDQRECNMSENYLIALTLSKTRNVQFDDESYQVTECSDPILCNDDYQLGTHEDLLDIKRLITEFNGSRNVTI
jgi:hypothetical protein